MIGIAEIQAPVHSGCDTDPLVGAHRPVDALEVFTWLVLLSLDLVTPMVVHVVLPAVPAHTHNVVKHSGHVIIIKLYYFKPQPI